MESDSPQIAIDSSAWIAIRLEGPGHERLVDKLIRAGSTIVSAATVLETAMVLSRRESADVRHLIERDLRKFGIRIVGIDDRHSDAAIGAFLRYGKGRHPAALNFGDCISYAVARVAEVPLLFTGDDFLKTDIEPA